jgi:hypothetical protein
LAGYFGHQKTGEVFQSVQGQRNFERLAVVVSKMMANPDALFLIVIRAWRWLGMITGCGEAGGGEALGSGVSTIRNPLLLDALFNFRQIVIISSLSSAGRCACHYGGRCRLYFLLLCWRQ